MKTQKVQIETIKLDPSNPRSITKEAFERLKQSITDFPEMQKVKPLVVADGYALAGNMRLLAYKDLGYRELHVLDVSEWSQAKRDEFMIKDNTHYGTWDYDALANEWETLPLTDWGLDVWETEVEELKGLTDEDDVPEAPQEPITKLGDVWILGEHRVMCGDSTSKEAVEILMDGEKADMVFTDPPYGVDYDGGHAVKGVRREKLKNDGTADIYKSTISIMYRYSKKDTPLYLWYSDSKSLSVLSAVLSAGYEIRNNIIWNKNVAQFGAIGAQYKTKHEPCLYCYKKGQKSNWTGPNNEVSVWDIDRNSKNEHHPTQKPIALAERCIKNHKADTVLDLFLGSGSTLIAAEKTNRKCYGMELDPKYCDVIVKRWEDFTGKKAHLEENEFEVITQAH